MTREDAKTCAEGLLSQLEGGCLESWMIDSVQTLCKYVIDLHRGSVQLTLQEFQDVMKEKSAAVKDKIDATHLIMNTVINLNNFLKANKSPTIILETNNSADN